MLLLARRALFDPLVVGRLPATTTSNFRRAADHITQSAASYVVNSIMPLANITTTPARQRNLPTVSKPGQRFSMAPSAPLTAKSSASTTMSVESRPYAPIPTANENISVPSVAQNPTMLSPGPVDRVLHRDGHSVTAIDFFSSLTTSQFLFYRDFSNTIVHRDPLITADANSSISSDDIYLRIVHPYDSDAFHHFISKHHLTNFYSLLVTNLRCGFPLGEMPPIMDTVIFKNHPSAALHSDAITNYLTDELKAGRMSGPFSRQRVEDILRGPIFCSPLLVSVQTQQPGTPDKLRVCRHLSKGDKTTPSANSHIHKEDFPTRFDTALKVADIVCLFPPQLEAPFPFFTDPLLVGSLSRDPPLVARPSWDALLVPHFYTGSTSGGSFFVGCTSGAPFLHEIHFWWLVFIGCTSGAPSLHGIQYGSLVVAHISWVHLWRPVGMHIRGFLFPYPG